MRFLGRLAIIPLVFGHTLVMGDTVEFPISILNDFFDHNRDGVIEERPFRIEDLESIYSRFQISSEIMEDVTSRYLSISYPTEAISISQILLSSLPTSSKKILLSAPDEQITIKADINRLLTNPDEIISELSSFSYANEMEPVIASLLNSTLENKYISNIYYGTYTSIRDSNGNKYIYSTPSGENLVSEILDKTKGKKIKLQSNIDSCQKGKCKSNKNGIVFSSFSFPIHQSLHIRKDNEVIAACSYNGIYRREYLKKSEIEISFKNCNVVTINSKPLKMDSLLELLYRE